MLSTNKKVVRRTRYDNVGNVTQPDVALSRADLGLTEGYREFRHRIACLYFAGDAVCRLCVSFSRILAAL